MTGMLTLGEGGHTSWEILLNIGDFGKGGGSGSGTDIL